MVAMATGATDMARGMLRLSPAMATVTAVDTAMVAMVTGATDTARGRLLPLLPTTSRRGKLNLLLSLPLVVLPFLALLQLVLVVMAVATIDEPAVQAAKA